MFVYDVFMVRHFHSRYNNSHLEDTSGRICQPKISIPFALPIW